MINTVLIVGIQGLIGKSLASNLLDEGYAIYGIARCNTHVPKLSIRYLFLDLASDWSIENLPKQCDAVIHLAQSASFRNFPTSALDVFKVNIQSTAKLLDYARQAGVKKFVYASSGGVYGNGNQAFKENAPIVPTGKLGYYLGSKACGEILVQSYASIFDTIIIRPFFVYGPGQKRDMLIPRLFDSVATGKPITLQGESGIRINPIHVNDAVSAVAAALNLGGSATFNIAGPDVLSIREICESIGHYLNVEPIFDQQLGEPNNLIANISAMQKFLHNPVCRLNEYIQDVKL
jgi:UDP-glucose 4-epimerase